MRASLPTVASAESTRQVNTRPASDASMTSVVAPKLPAGTIHSSPRVPKVGGISMNPTHSYASGMQGVHVTHEV